MTAFLGAEWATWVVVGVFLPMIVALSWGYFTRWGSEMDEHPIDARGRSPGAREPPSASGAGRTPESPTGPNAARGRYSGHGTR
jgi:hypothetical protein